MTYLSENYQLKQRIIETFEESFPPFNLFFDDLTVGDPLWGPNHIQYLCFHMGASARDKPSKIAFNIDDTCIEMKNMSGGIWVNPHFRNKGYGKLLIKTIENIAKKSHISTIHIHGVTNPSFWEKLDYTKIATSEYHKSLYHS